MRLSITIDKPAMYRLLSKTIAIDRGVDYRYISAWLVIDIYLYINFADVERDLLDRFL